MLEELTCTLLPHAHFCCRFEIDQHDVWHAWMAGSWCFHRWHWLLLGVQNPWSKNLVKGLAARKGAVLGLSGSPDMAGSDALWRQLRGSMGNVHSARQDAEHVREAHQMGASPRVGLPIRDGSCSADVCASPCISSLKARSCG